MVLLVVDLARVEGRQRMGLRWVSYLLQRTVLALLTDAAARSAVRRAARCYAERREALLRALASRGVPASGRSGMNVWLERAKALLRDSEMTVIEVAGETGWSSLAHFNAVFRRRVGSTPSQFRVGHAAPEPVRIAS